MWVYKAKATVLSTHVTQWCTCINFGFRTNASIKSMTMAHTFSMPETLNKLNIVTGACNDVEPELPRRTFRLRLLYLLVVAVLLIPATDGQCPAIDPHCYCRDNELICENLGEISQVPPFRPYNTVYRTLKITGETTLKTVQANAFRGVKVKGIELNRLGLKTIEPRAFSGLGDILERLDLAYNELETIPNDAFYALNQSLVYLRLHDNRLKTVSRALFSNVMHLEYLHLADNHLEPIPNDAFYSLSQSLETLYLDNNGLTTLDPALLRHMKNLERLSISNNRLESLSDDTFDGCKQSLKYLYLSDNHLTTLRSAIFSRLVKLELLTLHRNRLVCDCRLAWMRTSKLVRANLACFSPLGFRVTSYDISSCRHVTDTKPSISFIFLIYIVDFTSMCSVLSLDNVSCRYLKCSIYNYY